MSNTLKEFTTVTNAHIPLKCPWCHKPIDIEDDLIITKDGVYHHDCHWHAFPNEHDQYGHWLYS